VSRSAAALVLIVVAWAASEARSSFEPALFSAFSWRHVGPFLAGPATAIAGVPSQPGVFYAGFAGGGLWKTNDYGHTWRPVFDDGPTGAISAIAVAASDSAVVYAGTGTSPDTGATTGLPAGLFRSDDAGATWRSAGLAGAQRIARIAIDPSDPDRVFVAADADAAASDADRGVLRSRDGGRSFERVLRDDRGALDVQHDPSDPDVLYAVLSAGSPIRAGDAAAGANGVLFRSADGGSTWAPRASGLPHAAVDGTAAFRIAIAPSRSSRLYAVATERGQSRLYRSDDAGAGWTPATAAGLMSDPEGSTAGVAVDPRDPDAIYVSAGALWRSADAGASFTRWPAGAGPDRVNGLWIDPRQPHIVAVAHDGGATVSITAGETWSAPRQSTSGFSRVAADAAFPYRVCGSHPARAPRCVPTRGARGVLTAEDWIDAGGGSPASIAPHPTEAGVLFRGGERVTRIDTATGQVQDLSPDPVSAAGAGPAAPLLFSPSDRRALLFGARRLWRSTNLGQSWTAMSPDLARDPAGAITALAPSPIQARLVWAGTSDGAIHVTSTDGESWSDVTPQGVAAGSSIAALAASHFDDRTAYAAIVRPESAGPSPQLWRTRDAGASWTRIDAGLPRGAVHAVGEDPFRRGLLFAGGEAGVYISFDDGESWQSLELNLPPASVRDLTIRDADLIVATEGRGLWILDDLSPLRQLTVDLASADLFLFRPQVAWRSRSLAPADSGRGSGSRAEASPNPPEGAALGYLAGAAADALTLEIVESLTGEVVRRFADDDVPSGPGLHRVYWDLRYEPLPVDRLGLSPARVRALGLTRGLWVLPGAYQVRLAAGERALRQAVVVRMDPRIRTAPADLNLQFKLSKSIDQAIRQIDRALREIEEAGASMRGGGAEASARAQALRAAALPLAQLFASLQQGDVRPTAAQEEAVAAALARAERAISQ
jgi:photosystem II stability/assembly factor-like uncharacterized protein